MTTFGVEGLSIRYGSQVAVDRVTLQIDPGHITVVLGGDGAGKTSLLRVLAGATEPTEGRVHRPDARRIGYVPAGPGAYPDLTVTENLRFSTSAYGRGADRIEELLRRTNLVGARDRLARHLSGGMRRKLAVGMALVHRPDLLVLDEPTTGIDPLSRVELWRLFAGAAAEGAAVALATTYVEEGERAGTVLLLEGGRALLSGSPGALVSEVPGAIVRADRRPAGLRAWRRGRAWRAWSPEGAVPGGTSRAHPDLEDAVMVAALRAGEAA